MLMFISFSVPQGLRWQDLKLTMMFLKFLSLVIVIFEKLCIDQILTFDAITAFLKACDNF